MGFQIPSLTSGIFHIPQIFIKIFSWKGVISVIGVEEILFYHWNITIYKIINSQLRVIDLKYYFNLHCCISCSYFLYYTKKFSKIQNKEKSTLKAVVRGFVLPVQSAAARYLYNAVWWLRCCAVKAFVPGQCRSRWNCRFLLRTTCGNCGY